uniref:Uncharacterized protein n=1 Tax=Timema cristinae TaxID=61476 RepID=A0A7R9GSC9_TIMCR|nr:unnamed protein product [Timema cristinae]
MYDILIYLNLNRITNNENKGKLMRELIMLKKIVLKLSTSVSPYVDLAKHSTQPPSPTPYSFSVMGDIALQMYMLPDHGTKSQQLSIVPVFQQEVESSARVRRTIKT